MVVCGAVGLLLVASPALQSLQAFAGAANALSPDLKTLSKFNKNEQVFTVPNTRIITAESALRDQLLGPRLIHFQPKLADYSFISLAFMHYARLGDQSDFHSWLQRYSSNSPKNLPLLWNADLRQQLAESTTAPFDQRLEAISDDYAWLQENVFDADPMVFPEQVFSKELFTEAVALAISRCVLIPEEEGVRAALVPLIDEIARDTNPSIEIAPSQRRAFFGGADDDGLRVVATRQLEEGTSLSVGYAGGTCGEVFIDCGSLPDRVPVEVSLSFEIDPEDRNAFEKEDILESQGIGALETFVLSESDPLPSELIAFLRLRMLDGADTFLLESVFRDILWLEHIPLPISEENEQAVLNLIVDTATLYIRRLRSSMQQDLAILSEEPSSSVAHQLAALRYAERRALEAVQKEAERQLRSLKELEYYQERRLRLLNLTPIESEEELDALRAAGRALSDGGRNSYDW